MSLIAEKASISRVLEYTAPFLESTDKRSVHLTCRGNRLLKAVKDMRCAAHCIQTVYDIIRDPCRTKPLRVMMFCSEALKKVYACSDIINSSIFFGNIRPGASPIWYFKEIKELRNKSICKFWYDHDRCFALSSRGEVFNFISRDCSKGIAPPVVKHSTFVSMFKSSAKINKLVATGSGDLASYFLVLNNGDTYGLGYNGKRIISSTSPDNIMVFTKLNQKYKKVFAIGDFVLALGCDRKIYCWGKDQGFLVEDSFRDKHTGVREIFSHEGGVFFNKFFQDILVVNHYVGVLVFAIDSEGCIWSWGKHDFTRGSCFAINKMIQGAPCQLDPQAILGVECSSKKSVQQEELLGDGGGSLGVKSQDHNAFGLQDVRKARSLDKRLIFRKVKQDDEAVLFYAESGDVFRYDILDAKIDLAKNSDILKLNHCIISNIHPFLFSKDQRSLRCTCKHFGVADNPSANFTNALENFKRVEVKRGKAFLRYYSQS